MLSPDTAPENLDLARRTQAAQRNPKKAHVARLAKVGKKNMEISPQEPPWATEMPLRVIPLEGAEEACTKCLLKGPKSVKRQDLQVWLSALAELTYAAYFVDGQKRYSAWRKSSLLQVWRDEILVDLKIVQCGDNAAREYFFALTQSERMQPPVLSENLMLRLKEEDLGDDNSTASVKELVRASSAAAAAALNEADSPYKNRIQKPTISCKGEYDLTFQAALKCFDSICADLESRCEKQTELYFRAQDAGKLAAMYLTSCKEVLGADVFRNGEEAPTFVHANDTKSGWCHPAVFQILMGGVVIPLMRQNVTRSQREITDLIRDPLRTFWRAQERSEQTDLFRRGLHGFGAASALARQFAEPLSKEILSSQT